MLGSMDRIAIFSPSNNSINIVIEGCFIDGPENERVEVIWTISNYNFFAYEDVNNYFNKNITSSQVYDGEIIFDDGTNSCLKLCEEIHCVKKVTSIYKEETFSFGILEYFVIALVIVIVIVILIIIFVT